MAAPVVNGNAGTKVQQNLRPNQSLYIQNLSVKEKKEDLLRLLYITFASEAQVIDVTVLKSEKMRGQAHILLKDVQSATYAMEKLQSTMFLDRPLKISYSKNRSKTLDKILGTTVDHSFEAPSKASATPNSGQQASAGLPRPPGSLPPPPSGLPAPPGSTIAGPLNSFNLPPAPTVPVGAASKAVDVSALKRKHEGSEDEAEEEDDGSEMEMSEDDDD